MFEMYTEYTPYNYCNNSPMMFRDPSGMSMEIALVGTGMDLFNFVYGMIEYGDAFLDFGYEANSVYPVRAGGGGGGSGGNGVVTLASTRAVAAANSNAAEYGGGNETMFSFYNPDEPVTINGPVGGRDAVVNTKYRPDVLLGTPKDWSVESMHSLSNVLIHDLIHHTSNKELGFFWVFNNNSNQLWAKNISSGNINTWISLSAGKPKGLSLAPGDVVIGFFHTHTYHDASLDGAFQFSPYDGRAFFSIIFSRFEWMPSPENKDMLIMGVGTEREIDLIGVRYDKIYMKLAKRIQYIQENWGYPHYDYSRFYNIQLYKSNGFEILRNK